MRQLTAALVLLGAVALQGQTPVLGRVVAAAGGSPIPNARVTIEASGGRTTILTGPDGRFIFTPPFRGPYNLAAEKPGFVRTFLSGIAGDAEVKLAKAGVITGRVVDDAGEPIIGATVEADDVGDSYRTRATGQTDDLGEFRLAGLAQGHFAVVVTLPPGFFGSRLVFGPIVSDGLARSAIGGAAMPGGPGARLRVYYPGTEDVAQAQAVEVLAGEERAAIDFAVPYGQIGGSRVALSVIDRPTPSGSNAGIRGRVTRTDGRPISRAQVRLEPTDGSGIPWGTLTDEDGRYEIPAVRPGEYTLAASKRGYLEVEYGQTQAFDRGLPLRLTGNERRTGADIALPRYAVIAGRVFDENGDPIEGARVQALQVRFEAGRIHLSESHATAVWTTDQGAYRVRDLQPGQYLIRAVVGQAIVGSFDVAQPAVEIPGYAPTYFPGTPAPSDARFVSVGVSDTLAGLDFPLARVATSRIAGHAFNSAGAAVQGGLTLTPSERSGAIATTPVIGRIAPDGAFEFPNVPPGEYVIQASMGRRDVTTEGEFAAHYVVVNESDVTDLVIRTSSGSTLSGRIAFEGDGTPPRPQEIGIAALGADPDLTPRFGVGPFGAGPPARATPNSDGTFEIAGLNGPRRLALVDPPAGWGLKGIYLNGIDLAESALMFGRLDQSVRDVQVVLTNRITQIEGIVSDARGAPARSCTVVAFPVNRNRWYYRSRFMDHSVCTIDGAFVIRRLPPGDYYIAAIPRATDDGPDEWQNPAVLESLRGRAMRIVLMEGEKRPANLELPSR